MDGGRRLRRVAVADSGCLSWVVLLQCRHTPFSVQKDGTGSSICVSGTVAQVGKWQAAIVVRKEIGTTAPTPAMRSRGPIMRWGRDQGYGTGTIHNPDNP